MVCQHFWKLELLAFRKVTFSGFWQVIEYGLEAMPPILGLQFVFLAARRDDDYVIIVVRARNYSYNYNLCGTRQQLQLCFCHQYF